MRKPIPSGLEFRGTLYFGIISLPLSADYLTLHDAYLRWESRAKLGTLI